MNSTIYLKESLISRIKSSTDIQFLKAIQTIFDSSESELFELSDEQKKSIEQGRKEVKEGKTIPHHQVMKETEEWLKNL